jgi:hypothetical protein
MGIMKAQAARMKKAARNDPRGLFSKLGFKP